MPRCFVALGGNVGDVEAAFDAAHARLAAHPAIRVVASSPVFRTRPVGPRAGGEFRNAALELLTDLDPLSFLDVLQELERLAGREAQRERWSPRPLDLDLIFYGNQVVQSPRLIVPHPAAWYRRFVLDPLCTIAPSVIHPIKGATVDGLRTRLLPRPLCLGLAGSTVTRRKHLAQSLSPSFREVAIRDWVPGTDGDAIVAWLGIPDLQGQHPEGRDLPQLAFEDLPLLPRLDLSGVADAESALRGVLESVLGCH